MATRGADSGPTAIGNKAQARKASQRKTTSTSVSETARRRIVATIPRDHGIGARAARTLTRTNSTYAEHQRPETERRTRPPERRPEQSNTGVQGMGGEVLQI